MLKDHQSMLSNGLKKLGLDLSVQAQETLLQYLRLLEKWNRAYNLTAISHFDKMITHHLLDSLSVLPALKGKRILDVGTGAGLPGIPLAIASPDQHFSLLDSNGKKVRFLLQAKAELKLDNIIPIQSRIEAYRSEACFDAIISRAFTSAQDLIDKSQHLLCNTGQYLLMKGQYPEFEELPAHFQARVLELVVPGLDAKRHLMIISKEE